MNVVAAVVQRGDRYLLCRRPLAKRHGGLWEFPGGKVAAGESFDEALERELLEELGVTLGSTGSELGRFQDESSVFVIHFLRVDIVGEPVAHEHEALGWYSVAEIRSLELAPADRAFASLLST